jgi:3-phosphoinositide dependent protein kinase-1
LLPGENVLFQSTVEPRTVRRRASLLQHLPVPPTKPKTRLMMLTNQRLVCVKPQPNGRVATVKSEFAFSRGGLGVRDKFKMGGGSNNRCVIVSAAPKGEREFVVMTVCYLFCLFAFLPFLCFVLRGLISFLLCSHQSLIPMPRRTLS